jgi:hypothetical protein
MAWSDRRTQMLDELSTLLQEAPVEIQPSISILLSSVFQDTRPGFEESMRVLVWLVESHRRERLACDRLSLVQTTSSQVKESKAARAYSSNQGVREVRPTPPNEHSRTPSARTTHKGSRRLDKKKPPDMEPRLERIRSVLEIPPSKCRVRILPSGKHVLEVIGDGREP